MVSAAAGSVGSIVGQIAKIKGCRVVGIAGGAEKGRWLVDELGFDAAVDYKAGGLSASCCAEPCPEGIDVYFDNTGGEVFEACLFAMKNFGRIACCGAVSQYDGAPPPHGPRGIPGLIVTKRLTLRGFVVMDFDDQREAALKDLQGWVASGQLKVQEDIIDGPGEHARRPDRPAGRREPRQADGQGALTAPALGFARFNAEEEASDERSSGYRGRRPGPAGRATTSGGDTEPADQAAERPHRGVPGARRRHRVDRGGA